MANWVLKKDTIDDIVAHAHRLLDRRVMAAATGFPLNQDQIQSMVASPDNLAYLRKGYEDLGIRSIIKESAFLFVVEAGAPLLLRGCTLNVVTPEHVYYDNRYTRWAASYDHAMTGGISYPRLKLEILDERTRHEVVAWVNHLVRESRLRKMAKYTIEKIMIGAYLPTLAHLVVRWPIMAKLVTDTDIRQRVYAMRPRASSYGWDKHSWGDGVEFAQFVSRTKKLMGATDTVLAQALMLPEHVSGPDRRTVTVASVQHWEIDRSTAQEWELS